MNPASSKLPFYNGILRRTSGGLSGLSCLTQCAKVSSRSNSNKCLIPLSSFVKGKSISLLLISSISIGSIFYKKWILYNIWIVNSMIMPFSSLLYSDSISSPNHTSGSSLSMRFIYYLITSAAFWRSSGEPQTFFFSS